MRANHVIAVVVVLVVGFGAKQVFFSPVKAEAEINTTVNMDVLKILVGHPNRNNLPVQKINNMTFVYPESD